MLIEHIITPEIIDEGPNDPSIYKAIFLAGGPGSGKSYVVRKTALNSLGFKVINNDNAFERYLNDAGLEATPDNIYSKQGQELRVHAKEITNKQMQSYLKGSLGLVIDGTGKDYAKITRQADKLKDLGYEVAMIFVNTTLDTSLQRNRDRPRSIPDEEVDRMWTAVQTNIGKFQSYFKNLMYIIDNDPNGDTEKQTTRLFVQLGKWAKQVGSRRKKLDTVPS
jgi:tRNA uridine 5-carbamoylmethylation protein Kti12